MEQIKDMITLRAFALDKAVATFYGVDVDTNFKDRILNRAKDIESYILGTAKLPESYEDKTMDVYKDFMKDIASKPQPMWFNPKDMLPKEGEKVLCHIANSDKVYFGCYDVTEWWIEIDNEFVSGSMGDFRVASWIPIPEYNGKPV